MKSKQVFINFHLLTHFPLISPVQTQLWNTCHMYMLPNTVYNSITNIISLENLAFDENNTYSFYMSGVVFIFIKNRNCDILSNMHWLM